MDRKPQRLKRLQIKTNRELRPAITANMNGQSQSCNVCEKCLTLGNWEMGQRYYRKKGGTWYRIVQYLECWDGGQKQKRR
jgi:hypothetical protein